MPIHKDILAYNKTQSAGDRRICNALAKAIDRHLPDAENKIWHRHPTWFLDGNPTVGYHKLKDCIRLLFWSGQSFDEPGLKPEGTFKAAEARYTSEDQISLKDLKRWLEKSIEIQWDYKNIVKRKGKLERLPGGSTIKETKSAQQTDKRSAPVAASKKIDERTKVPSDWRGEMLARVRSLIKRADPKAVEEVKWRKPSNPAGVPVWSHAGILCTGETYKNVVKLTFARGASLQDPAGLFNSSLEGNTRRAIDIHEGDKINEKAFKALILAAVALNTSSSAGTRPSRTRM